MMKITKIIFGGYKNIRQVEIDFSRNNPISLVSVNNYGKSNVLTGLEFISDFIAARPTVRERMMCNMYCIPLNKMIENENFFASITFEYTTDSQTFICEYAFSFKWARQNINEDGSHDIQDGHIVAEKLLRKAGGVKQKYQALISRNYDEATSQIIALYKASETGRCSSKIGNLMTGELIIDRLSVMEGLYYAEMVLDIHRMQFYVENHLDARFAFEVTPLRLKGLKPLDIINDNNQLPKTLWYLKTKYPKVYEDICDKCKRLFPYIIEIYVDSFSVNMNTPKNIPEEVPYIIDDAVYVLYFKSPGMNQKLSFELVSDGFKRIILTLTNLELARLNGYHLIAIEEPENSIHPKLLKEYMDIICEYSQQMRIVFSSHSPYLISCIDDLNSIMIGLPNDAELAEFKHLTDHKGFLRLLEQRHEKAGSAIFNLLSEAEEGETCKLSEFWG